ncbi:hypothetical protein B0H10DRAFT_1954792 [Mycena sp. CBHHK59/15]|nr:hypothetical protein B0H10DRAFT_1954792 [Mycena sp. CBHHK59/15]
MNPSASLSRSGPGNVSFTAGCHSKSALALSYILANTTPEELHSRLTRAIVTPLYLLPENVDALLDGIQAAGILPGSIVKLALKDEDLRHCARCHNDYFEIHNGLSACHGIGHDTPQLVHRSRQVPAPGTHHSAEYMHFYKCCNRAVEVGAGSELPPHVDRHTIVASAVPGNDSHVRACDKCRDHDEDASATVASSPAATSSEFGSQIRAAFQELDREADEMKSQESMSDTDTEFESDTLSLQVHHAEDMSDILH